MILAAIISDACAGFVCVSCLQETTAREGSKVRRVWQFKGGSVAQAQGPSFEDQNSEEIEFPTLVFQSETWFSTLVFLTKRWFPTLAFWVRNIVFRLVFGSENCFSPEKVLARPRFAHRSGWARALAMVLGLTWPGLG